MKLKMLLIVCVIFISQGYSQWQNVFTSSNINYTVVSGWVHFDKVGSAWKSRLYKIDTLTFKIMEAGYSNTTAYTYTFNEAERLLGEQVYSTGYDLNGNNMADFYVLYGYGTSTSYREAFKIFDVSTGAVIFQKDDAAYSYSYPTFYDLDNDGFLECVVVKYDWPSQINYTYEIYKTNSVTDASTENSKQPTQFKLMQNYPNPFNPSTSIDYSLSSSGNVKLRIYDIKGETIRVLVNDTKTQGNFTAEWNGMNDAGVRVPSGIYFYELLVNNQRQVNKMVFLK